MSETKAPFEKLMIQRDVKKILRQLIKQATELYCKGELDVFFGFRPDTLNEDLSLSGKIVVLDAKPGADENVVINFSVGEDRFFTIAKFDAEGGRGTLHLHETLYRLERREHLRIPLIEGIEKSCNIIQWKDKVVFITTDIKDISQGGVRLGISKDANRTIALSDILKIVLHIKDKWQIEVLAEVRHVGSGLVEATLTEPAREETILGLKFVQQSESDFKKLLSLTMDLQREYVRRENAV